MIEMTIRYDEATGNVNVNGPINNKGVCYLMLECARDAVKDHVAELQKQPVAEIVRPNGLPDFARTRGRRKR
jgi:hypothetical protein